MGSNSGTGRLFLRCYPHIHHSRRHLRNVTGGQYNALKMALARVPAKKRWRVSGIRQHGHVLGHVEAATRQVTQR
jgi:hypothetical protein